MSPHNIEYCEDEQSVTIPSDNMNFFPHPASSRTTDKRASRLVSSSPFDVGSNDHRTPPAAPVTPCASEESAASSSPPAICITGRFSNVEGKYNVDPRVLGTGHHGSVRSCFDRATGRRCAVKSIRKSNPAVKLGGLAREILLLREMRHESIIRLVDVFEDEEHVHLVTDLCAGGELFDRIVEKSSEDGDAPCFSENEAARIMRQLLSAISHMHERGVVHRDVKPENILFETSDPNSPVRIINFGLSRRHRPGREPPMTTIVGTPYYIAPEVLRRRYDRSCDMWSAGVIAYTLLCGYPPFNGADNNKTHRAVLKGQYYFPAKEWKDASQEAMDFIHRLLQMDPQRRITAEQALNHPWIVKHVNTDKMQEEEREDCSSVEVVYSESPRKLPERLPTRSPPRGKRVGSGTKNLSISDSELGLADLGHAEKRRKPRRMGGAWAPSHCHFKAGSFPPVCPAPVAIPPAPSMGVHSCGAAVRYSIMFGL